MNTLKQGDRGVIVTRLQTLLNSLLAPRPNLSEDGDFGKVTRDAVMRFQKMKGLAADGIVGPRTWALLGVKGTPPAAAPPPASPNAPWMQIALAELGIHEDSLPGRHNQRIVEYHQATSLKATTDETPWCSSFVNWVMKKAGYQGTNNALAKSWLDWGTAITQPREGAITVIKKKGASSDAATGSSTGFHVAFCINVTPAHIRLLGGNQGDQVKYSNFYLSGYDIKGYRWPG